jgi:hypothetical protein
MNIEMLLLPLKMNDMIIRSYLKIRIFVRDLGETETQPAGIL